MCGVSRWGGVVARRDPEKEEREPARVLRGRFCVRLIFVLLARLMRRPISAVPRMRLDTYPRPRHLAFSACFLE